MPKVRDAIQLVEQDGWVLVRRSSERHLGQRHAPRNYAVHVPDLPGCVATGSTREEAVAEIRVAIRLHVESLRAHGEPVPEPHCTADVVDVAAAG